MVRRRGLSVLFVVAGLFGSGAALADVTAADKALADTLFEEGKRLMKEDRAREACLKFEASYKADPSVGTLLNLGACYEKLGRLASASGAFGEAMRLGRERGDAERSAVAKERRELADRIVARLEVRVPFPLDGVVVALDGKELDPAMIGVAIPVDQGRHVVDASAKGRAPYHTEIEVENGRTTKVVYIPELTFDLDEEAPKGTEVTEYRGERVGDAELRSRWGAVMGVGIAMAAAGVVGLGVGTGYGLVAMRKNELSAGFCDAADPGVCSESGYALLRTSGRYADISTTMFVAGGALVALGIPLAIVGHAKIPRADEVVSRRLMMALPVVGPSTYGFMMRAEF